MKIDKNRKRKKIKEAGFLNKKKTESDSDAVKGETNHLIYEFLFKICRHLEVFKVFNDDDEESKI